MDQRRVQIHHLNEQDLQDLFMEAQRKAKNRDRRQLHKKKKKALKQLERERAEREALEEERRALSARLLSSVEARLRFSRPDSWGAVLFGTPEAQIWTTKQ